MSSFIKKYGLYIAWIVSLVAMGGSLYFSSVLGFPPCVLCWYQRIAIYPLVVILAVGIIYKDVKVYRSALALSSIGLLISIYHNLLYFKILPESIAPCTAGVSCTTKFIEYFGFITIPFLALVALIIITGTLLMYRHAHK
jgi:disulfide bond formation protein DsbB